jgi:nitronate monooxygenase
MLRVSGPRLVEAACRAGVVGAFPAVNARSTKELDSWLTTFDAAAAQSGNANAPYCANLIMRHDRLRDDLACLIDHRVEMVITSVGSPAPVVGPLRDIGALVLADVATLSHVDKAVGAGVDGVVLLSAGAGGQTGWLNPFAFVRAVREKFDGVIVLAGGMSDGTALYAATILGCDLGYMGTKFIATSESLADVGYKRMLVDSTIDDIHLTRALTGIPANVLVPSILQNGLGIDDLDETVSGAAAAERFSSMVGGPGPKRWVDIWSAGHSVSGVTALSSTAELINSVSTEFDSARASARSEVALNAPGATFFQDRP